MKEYKSSLVHYLHVRREKTIIMAFELHIKQNNTNCDLTVMTGTLLFHIY